MSKTYKDLEVYKISFVFIRVHRFSKKLPKHETYELGGQLRRSADGVISNIVEGYGRKRYKKDLLKFLIYSHSGNDETINHIHKIIILYPELSQEGNQLIQEYNLLGSQT